MVARRLSHYPNIVRDPRILGGESIIAGTRIPVWIVVAAWRIRPELESILQAYPALTRELVEEALAYGETHRQEIETALAENDVELV
jgi:uncharacterized protein (DUF433 family)